MPEGADGLPELPFTPTALGPNGVDRGKESGVGRSGIIADLVAIGIIDRRALPGDIWGKGCWCPSRSNPKHNRASGIPPF